MREAMSAKGSSNAWRAAVAVLLVLVAVPAAAGDAKGSITYKDRKVDVKYAYMVSGPDLVTKENIRRVILSPVDLSGKIAACAKMSCTDAELNDGLSIIFDSGPRLNYWMVMNGQKIQYSGTEPKASFVAKADDAKKIAGTLKFDKTGAGGPKVDVEFSADLVKALTAP